MSEAVRLPLPPRLEVDGHSYCYREKGEGPALLLLHGLGGSSHDWHFVFDDFAPSHRTLALDMLGAGLSDKPADADYSIPAQAVRVARFLETLGISRAHIAGNSYGGALGLRLAACRPDLVDRLVLLDPASLPQKMPQHVRILRTRGFAEVAVALPPRKWLVRRTLRDVFHDPSKIREEDVAHYAAEMAMPGARRAMLRIARHLYPEKAAQYLSSFRRIQAPTLILWGEEDRITPLRNAHFLKELIPGSRLRTIPNCGHCPHMEFPRLTKLAILDFLT